MNKISKNISRREFLCGALGIAAVAALPRSLYAGTTPLNLDKELSFHNLHTAEKIALNYYERGEYVTEALRDISYLLRDHRTNETLAMDPLLIDFLYDLKGELGTSQPFQVISGYRSPKSNAALRKNSSGVATKSLHMQGKAIDIRIDGIHSRDIRAAAISLARGGVGHYPSSNFVHIDTGAVRTW